MGTLQIEKDLQTVTPLRRKADRHDAAAIASRVPGANNGASTPRCSLDTLHAQRVLLVDDIKINILIIKKILESKGWVIDVADNGAQALEFYQNSPHAYYNLILTDVIMPVMDGLEEARRIRALARLDAKLVPIIAVTSISGSLFLETVLQAGIDACVFKPIEPEILCNTIARLLIDEPRMNIS